MKKMFYVMLAFVGMTVAACGGQTAGAGNEVDSVDADTVVVDTTVVDTTVVDTVNTDSVQ